MIRPIRTRLHLLVLVAAVAVVVAFDALGGFLSLNNSLVAARMKAAPVPASGRVVFVAIDTRSLLQYGKWPWSRQFDAQIIRTLAEAGAREIFLDMDLSLPTDEWADRELAQAFRDAGGSILLPVFRQAVSRDRSQFVWNRPLKEFADSAWITTVNLSIDPDWVVRRYPYGSILDDNPVPSVASILSGVFGQPEDEFLINFALQPSTIPTVSVVDLLEGNTTIDFTGRSVVIGADAQELRSAFAVPVHGSMSGGRIHILAAETLSQRLVLRTFNRRLAMVIAIAFSISLIVRNSQKSTVVIATLCVLGIFTEALAFWAQSEYSVIIATPVLHAILFSAAVVTAGRTVDVHRWLLRRTLMERTNIQRIFERVIADSNDAILVVDEHLCILFTSRSAEVVFGSPDAPLVGENLRDIVPRRMVETAEMFLTSSSVRPASTDVTFVRGGETRHLEFTVTPSTLWRIPVGTTYSMERQTILCLTARDVTATRRQQERIKRLARYDALTGALNRSEFIEQLTAHVEGAGDGSAVLSFNLFRLRTINSTLGRVVGDALLVQLVERINRAALGISPVARLGGDGFAFYTLKPAARDAAGEMAEKLMVLFERPFVFDGHHVRIGLRVGVAVGRFGAEAEGLLNKAELALDEARSISGSNVCVFERAAFARQERARRIERVHWAALAKKEMFLVYQPQVNLGDGRMTGAEALLRWNNSEMGMISPEEFVPIAESSGFVETMGRWVLSEACKAAASWPDNLDISVNVSPVQFTRGDIVKDVAVALRESGLAPERLCLEITESVLLEGVGGIVESFRRLREMGVDVAIDDFGTGFSSLAYLAKVPINTLKLDQIFVQALASDPYSEAVVRTVVSLCRELGLSLICEGVENGVQADMLRALGCDHAQGYLFDKPLSHREFLNRVAANVGLEFVS